jgi:hypothetical protein
MSTMGHTSSKLTAIRAILSAAPSYSRSHLYRWGRLDQTDLKRLVQELEEGGHVVVEPTLSTAIPLAEMDMAEFQSFVQSLEPKKKTVMRRPGRITVVSKANEVGHHFVCLEDGRIAKRIDLARALPLVDCAHQC